MTLPSSSGTVTVITADSEVAVMKNASLPR